MCTDCDESGTAFKVYAGGNIAPHTAVEIAYIDFGHASGTLTGLDLTSNSLVPLPAKLRSNAFVLAGVGKWEIYPKLTVEGKAGIALVRTSISLTTYGIEERSSRVHPYGGLAVGYEVLKDIRVVGHYDLTKYKVEGEKGTLYQVGLGLQSGF